MRAAPEAPTRPFALLLRQARLVLEDFLLCVDVEVKAGSAA